MALPEVERVEYSGELFEVTIVAAEDERFSAVARPERTIEVHQRIATHHPPPVANAIYCFYFNGAEFDEKLRLRDLLNVYVT